VTAVLAVVTIVSWGLWIPVAQVVTGVPQSSRTFYVTVGNLGFAAAAFAVGGGHLSLGWRGFWLPLVGGMVWTAGNVCAFRATAGIGLARASGTWTPLNIVVAFVWGVLLFGELDRFDAPRFAVLGIGMACVVTGVVVIVRSADDRVAAGPGERRRPGPPRPGDARLVASRSPWAPGGHGRGLVLAGTAGVLWGSYFVPAQWAHVPAQVGNVPLALGIVVAGTVVVLADGGPVRLSVRVTALQVTAGVLFGIGDVALLGLVARVGTGVGFTLAQLSLGVNVAVGIFVFKTPRPGTRAARVVVAGILLAAAGGVAIGSLR
jgi:glucose uptake protein